MPQIQLRRYEQILERAIGRLVARTDLSDVSDVGIVKNILAAMAREQDEAYWQMTRLRDLFDLRTAAGEDLDERAAEIAPNTLSRLPASRAIGEVVFGRATTTGTVTIQAGTEVKTADGTVFTTSQQVTIASGSASSAATPIVAASVGEDGNVPADTIVKFASKIPGVDTVTNPVGTSSGADEETDDSFRERIRNYIASLSRCTVDGLEFIALGVVDPTTGKAVKFASVFEDPLDPSNVTLYIDDGAGTAADLGTAVVGEVVIASALGGEEFLDLIQTPVALSAGLTVTSSFRGTLTVGTEYYVNPANGRLFFVPALTAGEQITASYTPYVNLIAEVQKVIDGDPADRANFPGFRAAGVHVRVLSPTVVPVDVQGFLFVDRVAKADAIANAQQAVLDYVNSLGISGDVIRNEVIDRIMGVDGVVDVQLDLPAANINILDDQIPRISAASLINLT
jgi:uncharacterized phage protein gp47/JayE